MRQSLVSLSTMSVLLFGDISSAMNVNEPGDSGQASSQRAAKAAISESDCDDWFESARSGDIDKMKSLMRKGIDVNRQNKGDQTALGLAARNGHVNVVDLLLFSTEKIVDLLNMYKNRQRVGDSDLKRHLFDIVEYGEALVGAAIGGHTEIVEFLLDRGVDINFRDNGGGTALIRAASEGHAEIVELLLDRGADVNFQDYLGETALMRAATNGHMEEVELLLDRGADVNSQDEWGETALMRAADYGCPEIVELLLDHGADVNSRNDTSETALMWAAHGGYTEIVRLLLDRGADPNIEDYSKGRTALDYARDDGYDSEMISLLEEAQRRNETLN